MEPDKFCLKWNDFESNISTAFRELREDKDFFDVTLACDDDQIQAHKIILSACSPFFKTIFRRNQHEHPLLYLKGVKYTELVALLNFMYHGEVNVAQEDLNTFMAVAEELKIKGLTESSSVDNSKPKSLSNSINNQQKTTHKLQASQTHKKVKRFVTSINSVASAADITRNANKDDDEIQEILPVQMDSFNRAIVPASQQQAGQANEDSALIENMFGEDLGEFGEFNEVEEGDESREMQEITDGNKDEILDTMIESIIVRRMHPIHGVVHECSVCSKVLKKKNKMQQHAEIHLKGFTHQCGFCGKNYKNRPSLKVHISTTHKQEKDTNNLESILG